MLKLRDKKKQKLIGLFLITSAIFLILYNTFVFRGYAYVYSADIGSDTINSYYPVLGGLSNMLYQGDFSLFTLKSGLGTDLSFFISYFSHPFDLLAILFPVSILHIGILLGTYLKLITISLVSFRFFKMLLKSDSSAFLSALLWTFCSYTIIWGQHYVFCSNMVNFTIFMFLLQKWLSGSKKSLYILIPFMSFFLINSYYFFYMTGVFAVIYIIAYFWLQDTTFRYTFFMLLKLLLATLLAIAMSMFFFFPVLLTFINSPRSTSIGVAWSDLLTPYSLKTLVTEIGRFLHPDMIGNAFTYSGVENYYEAAFLSTSVLALYGIIYETMVSKGKKKKRVLLLLGFVSLCLPAFTYFVGFKLDALRWTFFLLLILCLCIGDTMQFIASNRQDNACKRIAMMGICIYLFLLLVLKLAALKGLIQLDSTMIVIVTIFALLYAFIFIKTNLDHRRTKKIVVSIILIEMIAMNYNAINNRGIEKTETFKARYMDGTYEAIKYLKSIDPSLYRIEKNYSSVFLNDSFIQMYNGYNSYSSVNSNALWELAEHFQGKYISPNSNYVGFRSELFQEFMGGKYLLSKEPLASSAFIKEVNGIYIYKTRYQLPFGYMYENQLDPRSYARLDEEIKIRTLAKGFVSASDGVFEKKEITYKEQGQSIMENFKLAIHCTVAQENGFKITGFADDMQLYYAFDKKVNTGEDRYAALKVKLHAEVKSSLQVFFQTGNAWSELESSKAAYDEGERVLYIPIKNYEGINEIRIDPSEIKQNLEIKEVSFVTFNDEELKNDINTLKENGVHNAVFANSTYEAEVENKGLKHKMLQIPITYSENWNAYIDGKSISTQSINNGLLGIVIPPGAHKIMVRYEIPYFIMRVSISGAAILLFAYLMYREGYWKIGRRHLN